MVDLTFGQGTPIATPQADFAKDQARIEKQKTEKQKCEDQGGTWDEATKTCILVKKEQQPDTTEQAPKVDPALETFSSSETGRASGITLPDGRTFLGLSPEEVQQVATGEQERIARPEGTAPVGTAQKQADQQFQFQQSLSQLGKVDPTTLELQKIQQAGIDWGQAWTAGTMGSAPSIVQTAAAGAVGGALAGGGTPASIGLAVIGAAVAVWRGMQSNIKEQQRGEIGATSADLQAGQLKMRQFAMAASRDPYHADYYIQLYNNEKASLFISQRQLQTEVTGNLNKWMDDGRVQLAKYNDFLKQDGIANTVYENKLRISLQMGVPLLPEDLE